jgi:hypothetical protein
MTKQIISTLGLAALLFGCGGAGDTANLPSMYMGSWSGTWDSRDANETGAISLAVTTDGSASGTLADSTGTGQLAGTINKNGRLTAIVSFSTGRNMVITGNVTSNGNRLTSSFNYERGGIQYGGSFDTQRGAASSTGTTAGGGA